jgi:hypothetical protein
MELLQLLYLDLDHNLIIHLLMMFLLEVEQEEVNMDQIIVLDL